MSFYPCLCNVKPGQDHYQFFKPQQKTLIAAEAQSGMLCSAEFLFSPSSG
jgi:hypothetical protein